MIINTTTPKTVEVVKLRAVMGVRYWEDGTVNDTEDTDGTLIPCRVKDAWPAAPSQGIRPRRVSLFPARVS